MMNLSDLPMSSMYLLAYALIVAGVGGTLYTVLWRWFKVRRDIRELAALHLFLVSREMSWPEWYERTDQWTEVWAQAQRDMTVRYFQTMREIIHRRVR